MDTYYNPADLEKFGDMAKDATEMGKAFFSYYRAIGDVRAERSQF